MKIYLIRGNAIMNYLTKETKITCANNQKKCDMHWFFHELLEIFLYNDFSIIEKNVVLKI